MLRYLLPNIALIYHEAKEAKASEPLACIGSFQSHGPNFVFFFSEFIKLYIAQEPLNLDLLVPQLPWSGVLEAVHVSSQELIVKRLEILFLLKK